MARLDVDKKRPRIYLAGPEVFLPDAEDFGRRKSTMADAMGFEGVFPLDASLDLSGLTKLEQARRISNANEALMRNCDLLIANLTPFRGASMDSGTAFEVGFMRALGRPVFGYTNATADYDLRAKAWRTKGIPDGDFDAPDIDIEDFGLAENLMIAIAIIESGGSVIRHQTEPGREATDLMGFRACLAEVHRLIPTGN